MSDSAHTVVKIYQEDHYSWKIQCSCGWREGAKSKKAAHGYHDEHVRRIARAMPIAIISSKEYDNE